MEALLSGCPVPLIGSTADENHERPYDHNEQHCGEQPHNVVSAEASLHNR